MKRCKVTLIFAVMLVLLLVVTGCGLQVREVAPGEIVDLTHTLDFYLATGDETYLRVTPELFAQLETLLLTDHSWLRVDGLDILSSELELISQPVNWSEGDTRYSIEEGLGLRVELTVQVAEDAGSGQKEIVLRLPNLGQLGNILEATPTFPKRGDFRPPDQVVVQTVRVHKTFFARIFVDVLKWSVIAIVGGVGLIGLVHQLTNGSITRSKKRPKAMAAPGTWVGYYLIAKAPVSDRRNVALAIDLSEGGTKSIALNSSQIKVENLRRCSLAACESNGGECPKPGSNVDSEFIEESYKLDGKTVIWQPPGGVVRVGNAVSANIIFKLKNDLAEGAEVIARGSIRSNESVQQQSGAVYRIQKDK